MVNKPSSLFIYLVQLNETDEGRACENEVHSVACYQRSK